jgi:hypothetical protein
VRFGTLLGAFALLAIFAASAAAAPSAKEQKEAAALVNEAEALRKKNDLAGALSKYQAAHEILYSPTTGLEVGRVYLELGRLVDAREALLGVARIEVAPNEPAKVVKAREEAGKLADGLLPRIPSVTIRVVRLPEGATLSVTIDDDAIPKVAIALPRKLDPGKHKIVARAEGTTFSETYDVTLAEGDNKTIEVTLGPPPVVVENKPPKPPPPIERPRSPLVYIGFSAAGVGLVVGGVSAIIAMRNVATLRDECVNGRCPPEVHDNLSTARTASTISTISFIVAGAGVGVGIYGLLTERKTTSAASIAPVVGIGMLGLRGEF